MTVLSPHTKNTGTRNVINWRTAHHSVYNVMMVTLQIYKLWVFSEKVSFWLFKIFEIQKGRTFSFNDILRLCTIVVNIAIQIRA